MKKDWVILKGKYATHYILKSEIVRFVWSNELRVSGRQELLEGLAVSLRGQGSSTTVIGPKSLESQIKKQIGISA